MTFSVSSLYRWPRHCTREAREIALNIVNTSTTPLATKDIYTRAIKSAHMNKPAPHRGEPIRSMRYLKTVVLQDLAARNHIEKVRIQGEFTAWLWRTKKGLPASSTKPKVAPPSQQDYTELTPVAVGVGEDWSHLNKRRQRARKTKVERDLLRMMEVQRKMHGNAVHPQ